MGDARRRRPYNFRVIPTSQPPSAVGRPAGRKRAAAKPCADATGLVLDHGREAVGPTPLDAEPDIILKMPEEFLRAIPADHRRLGRVLSGCSCTCGGSQAVGLAGIALAGLLIVALAGATPWATGGPAEMSDAALSYPALPVRLPSGGWGSGGGACCARCSPRARCSAYLLFSYSLRTRCNSTRAAIPIRHPVTQVGAARTRLSCC